MKHCVTCGADRTDFNPCPCPETFHCGCLIPDPRPTGDCRRCGKLVRVVAVTP